jgi:hypothetical protein
MIDPGQGRGGAEGPQRRGRLVEQRGGLDGAWRPPQDSHRGQPSSPGGALDAPPSEAAAPGGYGCVKTGVPTAKNRLCLILAVMLPPVPSQIP